MNLCITSPMYGKDNNKTLHFYCEYCGKEMGYNEERECLAERKMCLCGRELSTSEYQFSKCLVCDKKI
jgi:ribosomal protein L37E